MIEIKHYGVKGMKWGRRKKTKLSKKELNRRNESYSTEERRLDNANAFMRDLNSVKRINRRMNKGLSLANARQRETLRNILVNGAGVAAFTGGLYLINNPHKVVDLFDKSGVFSQKTNDIYNKQGSKVVMMVLNKSGTWVLK